MAGSSSRAPSTLVASSFVLAALAAGGRALAACDGADGGAVPSRDPEPADGAPPATSPPGPGGGEDGGAGRDADVLADGGRRRPSFCDGIVLRASFDRGLAPDEGSARARTDGGVGLVAGRFNAAAELTRDPDGGSAVYFDPVGSGDAGDAGPAAIYPQRAGSVAYWFRRAAPASRPGPDCFVRPYASRGMAGLVMARDGRGLGLYTDLGAGEVLTLDETELAPYLEPGGFDHVAYAWRLGDADAGVRALTRLAVNGGLGVVRGDAGGAGAGPSDAAASDAGELRLPYRAETATPLARGGALETLRVGGTPTTAPQGAMDDFVVWDRVLSFDEMAAVFRAGVDVGAACR